MAWKRRSKERKPTRGLASISGSSDRTRQSISPPKPAPDIPQPLGELPPEATKIRGITPQDQTPETPSGAPRIGLNAGHSETAKKSGPKERLTKSRVDLIR